ncbi:sensor histidine kinase [Spirillospora sp. CA-255316]
MSSRKRVRARPIRRRLAALLVVPLLLLVGLWAFATFASVSAALARAEFTRASDDIGGPVGMTVETLRRERAATAAVLGSRGAQGLEQLRQAQKATDGALSLFRQKALPAASDLSDPEVIQALRDLDNQSRQLGSLRAQVAARSIAPLEAITRYNNVSDSTARALFSVLTDLARSTVWTLPGQTASNDVKAYQVGVATLYGTQARDHMMREDAVVTLVQARGRWLSAAEYAAFVQAAADRRRMRDLSFDASTPAVRGTLGAVNRSPQLTRFQQLEQAIIASPTRRPSPTVLAEWSSTLAAASETWSKGLLASGAALESQHENDSRAVTFQLALVGGLGLLIVIASAVLSWRFARGISVELRTLQRAAQELAQERLPRVVARLRQGEEVNVADEAPVIRGGRTAEIASVAEAFGTVQRTAIETAVGEAQVRAGISRVFINLAWRNQSLLHRQLRLLDAMERRTSDPDELEDLFRLDHLTTRMRRHAEGLVILSGKQNVRGWSEPVALEQLLRAAVAEVEDYARVDVMALSPSRVEGSVVADVVHLLAELIENATAFSPPNTEVLVRADQVGNGLAVEVVDRGIGLDADDLAEINRRLADPPEFDLADSDRLGLFVVARLAARHDIQVVLQPSAYGGVTAVVLLPTSLLADGEGAPTAPTTRAVQQNGSASWPVTRTGRVLEAEPLPPALVSPGPAMEQTPSGGRHRAAPPPAPPAAPAPPPVVDEVPEVDRPAEQEGEYDAETGGLPRRVRQRNLAPQLRAARKSRETGPQSRPGMSAGGDEQGFADRPAETNRDLLSSLQSGWTAARGEDEDVETDGSAVFDERIERGNL